MLTLIVLRSEQWRSYGNGVCHPGRILNLPSSRPTFLSLTPKFFDAFFCKPLTYIPSYPKNFPHHPKKIFLLSQKFSVPLKTFLRTISSTPKARFFRPLKVPPGAVRSHRPPPCYATGCEDGTSIVLLPILLLFLKIVLKPRLLK